MKKTYLITGGTGFIGSAIAKRLIKEKNCKVICTDSNLRGDLRKIREIKNSVKFIKQDIRNLKSLKKISKKVDSIIHLAFLNGTKNFYEKPGLVLDIGVKGIMNVIEACRENKIKELIIASSSEVYHSPLKIPTKENEPIKIPDVFNPRFSYSAGKILTEIISINNSNNLKKLLIFRPHNVYGPDMGFEHVIPELIFKIFKNSKNKKKVNLKIKGSGDETRAFNYIDDFVDGFMIMLKKGKHLNIYNIGSDEEISIKSLVKNISKISKIKINIRNSEIAKGSTLRRCPDITKLKKLGYKPKIKIKNGLIPMINWYKKNLNLKKNV
tara:strand:+ start:1375 stop:2349 length:975 start_codon:yes stop_codon:yes gene_type:complete